MTRFEQRFKALRFVHVRVMPLTRLTKPPLARGAEREPLAVLGFRAQVAGKEPRVVIAASTVAIVAIAAVIIVALIVLMYIVPRGGRRRRPKL